MGVRVAPGKTVEVEVKISDIEIEIFFIFFFIYNCILLNFVLGIIHCLP